MYIPGWVHPLPLPATGPLIIGTGSPARPHLARPPDTCGAAITSGLYSAHGRRGGRAAAASAAPCRAARGKRRTWHRGRDRHRGRPPSRPLPPPLPPLLPPPPPLLATAAPCPPPCQPLQPRAPRAAATARCGAPPSAQPGGGHPTRTGSRRVSDLFLRRT